MDIPLAFLKQMNPIRYFLSERMIIRCYFKIINKNIIKLNCI